MRSLYEGPMALREEEEREELLAKKEDDEKEEAKSDGYSYYDEGSDSDSGSDTSTWTCSRFPLLVLIMVVLSAVVLGLGYLLAQ